MPDGKNSSQEEALLDRILSDEEKRFWELCHRYLDLHGAPWQVGRSNEGIRADIGKCFIIRRKGWLDFRDWRSPDNSADEAIVWAGDRLGKQKAPLLPFILMLEEAMVLDELANA